MEQLPASNERAVLAKVLSFFGANLIVKHSGIFYQGGYFSNPSHIELYQQGIMDMLPVLKNEAISMIDAIAPPDFIINSPLGMSDGNVYQHMERAIISTPGVFERPNWWREVTYKDYLEQSKL